MNFNPKNVDWDRLYKRRKTLKLFQPTEDKLKHLYGFLADGELNVSDENRTPVKLDILLHYFFGDVGKNINAFHLFFEIGNYDGILGLTDIYCGYKCNVFFKLWNKENFSHTNVKDIKDLLETAMEELKLRRLSLSTPDLEKGVRLSQLAGFRVESRQKFGFLWKGKYITNYLLRKI